MGRNRYSLSMAQSLNESSLSSNASSNISPCPALARYEATLLPFSTARPPLNRVAVAEKAYPFRSAVQSLHLNDSALICRKYSTNPPRVPQSESYKHLQLLPLQLSASAISAVPSSDPRPSTLNPYTPSHYLVKLTTDLSHSYPIPIPRPWKDPNSPPS